MDEELKDRFKRNLQKLVGKECWGIVDSAGSRISFDFGEKIRRKTAANNVNLSKDVRFDAEFSFLIFCVWRIESSEEIICGAWSESKDKANHILNQKVIKIAVEEPFFDLSLSFSNGLKLKVFCDSTN